MKLARAIRVAVIQTTLDESSAWADTNTMQISASEETRSINEIGRGFSDLHQNKLAPDIVILPELAVPRGFINELRRLAESLHCLVIAGVDYTIVRQKRIINQGVLIVPEYWGNRRSTFGTTIRFFGKTYASEREKKGIEDRGYLFQGAPAVWIIDSREFGKFGVCICYDLLDLCRLSMYRGRIHHLFAIAYNKDLSSFQHVAEAAARTIFCNVVVCNTGKYGGSLAIAPLHDPNRRIVFEQRGNELFDCQVFELKVESLAAHQAVGGIGTDWKSLPPGYRCTTNLQEAGVKIKSKQA